MMFINQNNQRTTEKIIVSIIFILTFAILLYCFSDGISGNDFWWHVKAGEWMFNHGYVPETDIFSWYGISRGINWTAHEWLSEIVFYIIYNTMGSIGIYLFSLGAAILLIILMINYVKKYLVKNVIIGGTFFGIFAVVASMFFYGRPHVFSFYFLFIELWCLYAFYENNSSKKIYAIPFISCLWSNFHGGSSNMSYILCIIFILAGMKTFIFGRIKSQKYSSTGMKRLVIVTLLSIISILVNPIGMKVFVYPYVNMADSFMMTVISEWQAPDAKDIGHLVLFFLPIVIITVGFITEKMYIRMIDILVMGIFLFMFLRSQRFIILWFIAAVFCGFRYVPLCKIKEIKKKSEKATVLISWIIITGLAAFSINKTAICYKNDSLISKVMTDEMVAAVKRENPKRIMNDYNLGEALIFNDIKVFIDSRADLYAADNILKDGISMMLLTQTDEWGEAYADVEKLIDKYNFDSVLMMKKRPLYAYMISHPERFCCVMEDDKMGYFKIVTKVR